MYTGELTAAINHGITRPLGPSTIGAGDHLPKYVSCMFVGRASELEGVSMSICPVRVRWAVLPTHDYLGPAKSCASLQQ